MSWAKGVALLVFTLSSAALSEPLPDGEAALADVMRQLRDLDQTLSVEMLNRAHQVQARLDLLDQLESKLLDIARKRQDRLAIETTEKDGPKIHDGASAEADPRVADIVGQAGDLTARLIAADRSTFAVKVGSKIGAYRVQAISAASGVEVSDPQGRRHNLPEVDDAEMPVATPTITPMPPAGLVKR